VEFGSTSVESQTDLGIAFSELLTKPCVGPLRDAAWSQGNNPKRSGNQATEGVPQGEHLPWEASHPSGRPVVVVATYSWTTSPQGLWSRPPSASLE
jgi:hypothetical protein